MYPNERTEFACPDDSRKALEALHSSHLIDALSQCHGRAASIGAELVHCTYFKLLDEQILEEVDSRDTDLANDVFWAQMNQLLILISRSASLAVQHLCDGILHSIGAQNALSLALLGRATIEHTCALCWLRTRIEKHAEVLSTKVWGATQSSPGPEITKEFCDLRRELFEFALGARVELNPVKVPKPSASKTKWQKHTEGRGKSVPEPVRVSSFMKYIDRIMSYEDYRDFRDIYESLSEYCHPNSASRTLDFHSSHVDHRKYLLVFREGIPLSIGFFNVFSLVLSVLPRCCDRLDQDLELIDGCRMPMSPLNEKEMATVQPIGRVAARDMFTARVFWTKPSQILAPTFSPAKLTARQTQRAQTVAHAFSEVVDRSEDEWLALFSTNMDIEGELQISEKMVTVYEAELNERPRSTLEERKWLFATVNDGVTCSDVGQLLSIRPELKSLPNLDRTFQRLRKWFSPVPPCESD